MNKRQQTNGSDKSKRQAREVVNPTAYRAKIDELKAWWDTRNVHITKFEARYYAETGGTLWTATVEVGSEHERLKPLGQALVVCGLYFPGFFKPTTSELRGHANPTFEVSWWTNDPPVDQ